MLKSLIMATAMAVPAIAAANTEESVAQVAQSVTIDSDVDYHITSTTPFSASGTVNITNTDNAVVIFDNLKPSEAKKYLGNIYVNGATAKTSGTGANGQLRVYKGGAIFLPYTGTAPLTVYTDTNYSGQSNNSYQVNTTYSLSGTFNNSIKSFKLKRGYMVCFATSSNGQGYSRVFIADKEDKNITNLPGTLKGKISFIRISKWNNVHKRGWAGYWSDATQEALNTSWCYNWDANSHSWDDREYVTQHHHEGWPGIADVGNNTGSANILGNNEPDNKADDKEQDIDVDNVLANWPQMMATGRRLGSPAVSGDYNWLYKFIDSIDARGWRCDFIAVHAYWYMDVASWKSKLEGISKRCGNRPIWITEMNYGANWTGWPGSSTSASDANYAIEYNHMAPILDYLNDSGIIERYAFYNNVQECRYAVADGSTKLTKIGEYYRDLPARMAYNSAKEYVPTAPKTKAVADLAVTFMPSTQKATLKFTNPNGEFADSIFIERKTNAKTSKWEVVAKMTPEESTTKTLSYIDPLTEAATYMYRIHIIDYNNKDLYGNEETVTVAGTEGTKDVQWGTVEALSSDLNYSFYGVSYDTAPAAVFGAGTRYVANTYLVPTVAGITKKYLVSRLFPWAYGSSVTQTFYTSADKAPLIVAPENSGKIGDLDYEAGYVKKNGATSATTLSKDTLEFSFKQSFKEAPVVMVTAVGTTTMKVPVIARVMDVTNTGFRVFLTKQAEEGAVTMPSCKVCYFAMEKGETTVDGKIFTVRDTTLTWKNNNATGVKITYPKKLTNPTLFAQPQTYSSTCTTLLRAVTLNSTQNTIISMGLDISNSNYSKSLPLTERVGYIAISDDPDYQPTGINGISESSADADADNVKVKEIFTQGLPVGVAIVKGDDGKAVTVTTEE